MAVLNSAILAMGATAIALPLGTLLAVLVSRFDLPGRRLAAICLGGLLLWPLYIHLSGWDAALGKLGWYAVTSDTIAQPLLAGMRGAVIVHGVAAIPWVAAIVGLGLLNVCRAEEEAALLVMPPFGVLARITLPQASPFILAAALWTVVSTTSEMTVTNIYLVDPRQQTYTERFYMDIALSGSAPEAAAKALPGMTGLLLLIGAVLWIVATLSGRPAIAAIAKPGSLDSGAWRPFAAAVLWLLIGLLVGVPVFSLIAKAGFVVVHQEGGRVASWSASALFQQLVAAPGRFARELAGTATVAFGAATFALAAALPLAWRARRGGRRAWSAALVIALCLALPGPLVGVVLIHVFNHDLPPAILLPGGTTKSWLLALYDHTPIAPILAQAIRALPLTMLLLWHSFATLDDDCLCSAALAGLNPKQVFLRIALRQRWRQVTAAWLLSFAIAAGDLAWAHLVTPPGLDLLSRRVFGLVHSGVEEQVAAIALIVVIAYVAVGAVVLRLLRSAAAAAS